MPRDWDLYYSDAANLERAPAPLLVAVAEMLPPASALDLACGEGRNAIHLARLGWRVTAVDASAVAIRSLRDRAAGLAIDARVADLERREFLLPPQAFDLVCDFYYLQRDLFPDMREAVRPGGVFAGAIHLEGSFALRPGELRDEFAGWKILYYSESDEEGEQRPSARILARRA